MKKVLALMMVATMLTACGEKAAEPVNEPEKETVATEVAESQVAKESEETTETEITEEIVETETVKETKESGTKEENEIIFPDNAEAQSWYEENKEVIDAFLKTLDDSYYEKTFWREGITGPQGYMEKVWKDIHLSDGRNICEMSPDEIKKADMNEVDIAFQAIGPFELLSEDQIDAICELTGPLYGY